jgi:hypothetical protein
MSSNNQEKYKYKIEIQQMMFVNGETCDPPVETTSLIEDIVRSQVVEMVSVDPRLFFLRLLVLTLIFFSFIGSCFKRHL